LTAAWLASLTESKRAEFLANLTQDDKSTLFYRWPFWARDNQLEPVERWTVWLLMAGRGFGKTRTGAEWVRQRVESGVAKRIAFVAETAADARDVMVEGPAGIMAISPKENRPHYEPSKRRLTWPNGAVGSLYSADEPGQLRGPQHDTVWADELAKWKRARQETWDNIEFGLRIGNEPRACVTTTPTPNPTLKMLLDDPETVVTIGSTYDNIGNLAKTFIDRVIRRYEGTRLGRQELHAELLLDTPGALWTLAMIDACRIKEPPEMKRVVVAIDPATTAGEESDETGIVVAGLGRDGRGYVLDDRSLKASPMGWAQAAISAYRTFKADRIVYESNQGGDMVRHTLETVDRNVPLKGIHASRGKQTRAEPVAALYEQGKVSHVGPFPKLEDQLVTWTHGDASPDRLDSLVYALTELLIPDVPLAGPALAGGIRPTLGGRFAGPGMPRGMGGYR
jgi:predicted phage terminase large subunit-like protein